MRTKDKLGTLVAAVRSLGYRVQIDPDGGVTVGRFSPGSFSAVGPDDGKRLLRSILASP